MDNLWKYKFDSQDGYELHKQTVEAKGAQLLQKNQDRLVKESKLQAKSAIRGQIEGVVTNGLGLQPDTIITKDDKKRGYMMVSQQVDNAVKAGIYDKGEGQEIKQELIDDVDNFSAEWLFKKNEKEDETIIDTYSALADKMVSGTFTNDDVILAKVATNDKTREFWNAVQIGYRQPPPTKTTFEGNKSVVDTVTGIPEGKIGHYEALKSLMSERYINQSITDEQFKLAIKQVKEPYPKHIAETLNGINEKSGGKGGVLYYRGFGPFFNDYVSEGEGLFHAKVMKNLMYWMDEEKTRTGVYPEPEAMYKEFRKSGVLIEPPKVYPKAPPTHKAPPKRTDPLYVGVNEDEKFNSIDVGTEYYDELLGIYVRKIRE